MLKICTLAACATLAFGHGRSTFSAEVRSAVSDVLSDAEFIRPLALALQEFPLVSRPAARGVKMTFGVALPQQQ